MPLKVGSKDGVKPGIDIKGGCPDGSSRGFLFLAPTIKAVKGLDGKVCYDENGKLVLDFYQWTTEPDLEELDVHDDSGLFLAYLITQSRPEAKQREAKPADRAQGHDRTHDRQGAG
jgi:hypothetical protein